MNVAQVRDVVRENVGRDKASEHMLTWALDEGLREIEKTGNYYWMRAVKTWLPNCDTLVARAASKVDARIPFESGMSNFVPPFCVGLLVICPATCTWTSKRAPSGCECCH